MSDIDHGQLELELDLDFNSVREDITYEVLQERARQDVKWGEQNHRQVPGHEVDGVYHPNGPVLGGYAASADEYKRYNNYMVDEGLDLAWDTILLEEVYEALEKAGQPDDDYEEELIQAAAVIYNMIESNRRRRNAEKG